MSTAHCIGCNKELHPDDSFRDRKGVFICAQCAAVVTNIQKSLPDQDMKLIAEAAANKTKEEP